MRIYFVGKCGAMPKGYSQEMLKAILLAYVMLLIGCIFKTQQLLIWCPKQTDALKIVASYVH